jgi:hypothetical protein
MGYAGCRTDATTRAESACMHANSFALYSCKLLKPGLEAVLRGGILLVHWLVLPCQDPFTSIPSLQFTTGSKGAWNNTSLIGPGDCGIRLRATCGILFQQNGSGGMQMHVAENVPIQICPLSAAATSRGHIRPARVDSVICLHMSTFSKWFRAGLVPGKDGRCVRNGQRQACIPKYAP